MRGRFATAALVFGVATLALGAFGAAIGLAKVIVVNGGATSVTSSRATLNGSINVTDPDSLWAFQISPSADYSKGTRNTQAEAVGTGLHAVSVTVSNLTPGTTYHFRLVLVQGSYAGEFNLSPDSSFTTLSGPPSSSAATASDRLSLRTHRLAVRGRLVSIALRCSGAGSAGCRGKVSLTAHGHSCGSGRFSVAAGGSHVVKANVGGACAALLRGAHGNTLTATLSALGSAAQSALKTIVTLIG